MSGQGGSEDAPIEITEKEASGYEPPAVTVLGTVAEVTQQGAGVTDELLNDGSQI